jgi:hypothetical protein
MAKRDNHYEAAFEAFLRARQIPYVAVDETRRSLAPDESLKNLDFIVSPPAAGRSWLVDVKGRRFPSGRRKQYWRNWCPRDELKSLASWELLFGPHTSGLLVFAYHLVADQSPLPAEHCFGFRDQLYAFVGIRLEHYASWARTLSPKWDTVMVPTQRFRQLAQPVGDFFVAHEQGSRQVG